MYLSHSILFISLAVLTLAVIGKSQDCDCDCDADFSKMCQDENVVPLKPKNDGPIRNIRNGPVKGKLERVEGMDIEVFLGIPYAKPPTGSLRFERPLPADNWSEERDTTKQPAMCLQASSSEYYLKQFLKIFPRESEDCLFVNVFAPIQDTNSTKLLAVYAYIHGGSNNVGTALMFDGAVFAAVTDVIVVTVAYRLGALGFMGIPGTAMEGDYGIHDQILALKWIQNNIEHFGGDKTRVTLAGHQAGSWDAGIHMLSPLSKGLFHQVVFMSGPVLSPWAYSPRRSMTEIRMYADTTSCDGSQSLKEIKSCMQKKDAEIVAHRYYLFVLNEHKYKNDSNYWRIYGNAMYPSDILPKSPPELIKNVSNINVDNIMLGIAADEAGISEGPVNYHAKNSWANIAKFVAVMRGEPMQKSIRNSKKAAELIKEEYANSQKPNDKNETLKAMLDIFSDISFRIDTRNLAESLANVSKTVYFYVFDHVSEEDPKKHIKRGATHENDLYYVFGSPLVGHPIHTFDNNDKKVSRLAMRLWGNFVKYGNPFTNTTQNITTKTTYDTTDQVYFMIPAKNKTDQVSFKKHYKNEKAKFWNEVIPKYIMTTN